MNKPIPSSEQGFSLIELMVALTIFAIGLLGLAYLQVALIRQNSGAQYMAQASLAANQMLGNIWAAGRSNVGDFNGMNTCTNNLPGTGNAAAVAAAWSTLVANTLPQGCGSVQFYTPNGTATAGTSVTLPAIATISVQWGTPMGGQHQLNVSTEILLP
jgi:type IV pilus assembly protein PilV